MSRRERSRKTKLRPPKSINVTRLSKKGPSQRIDVRLFESLGPEKVRVTYHIGYRSCLILPFLLKTCARIARFSCKRSPLLSDKRKLRALDSADGKALRPATKGICF